MELHGPFVYFGCVWLGLCPCLGLAQNNRSRKDLQLDVSRVHETWGLCRDTTHCRNLHSAGTSADIMLGEQQLSLANHIERKMNDFFKPLVGISPHPSGQGTGLGDLEVRKQGGFSQLGCLMKMNSYYCEIDAC